MSHANGSPIFEACLWWAQDMSSAEKSTDSRPTPGTPASSGAETQSDEAPRTGGMISRAFGWCAPPNTILALGFRGLRYTLNPKP